MPWPLMARSTLSRVYMTGTEPHTVVANRNFSDNANFINFCSGKTLTNGVQNKAGSCNGVGKSTNSSSFRAV